MRAEQDRTSPARYSSYSTCDAGCGTNVAAARPADWRTAGHRATGYGVRWRGDMGFENPREAQNVTAGAVAAPAVHQFSVGCKVSGGMYVSNSPPNFTTLVHTYVQNPEPPHTTTTGNQVQKHGISCFAFLSSTNTVHQNLSKPLMKHCHSGRIVSAK